MGIFSVDFGKKFKKSQRYFFDVDVDVGFLSFYVVNRHPALKLAEPPLLKAPHPQLNPHYLRKRGDQWSDSTVN